MAPPRVGISSCLLGQNVRYDGGHKLDPFAAGPLGGLVTLVPVCPEVEFGMGVPREPIRLERAGREVRLAGVTSHTDHTQGMSRFADRRAAELEALDLCGYIFKKNSPSCGPGGVPIHGAGRRTGRGLFAAAVIDRMPRLPVVDEGDLADPETRKLFVERVFAYRRLKSFFGGRWTVGGLVRFHAGEKLVLLAHEPAGYTDLGRLVARAKAAPRAELAARYQDRYMRALGKPATRSRHVNVLQHIAGYFKTKRPKSELEALRTRIDRFREGAVSLDEIRGVFRDLARAEGITYLEQQEYLA